MIEYKTLTATPMGIEGRTVTGLFCVHGNLDDGDGWSSRDRSHPGLFGDFTVDGRARAKFLWQHRSSDPPIATIDRLFEVSRVDLPSAVLAYAPDATGGVAVQRTYLDTPRGNEVLAGLVAGAITEMSYAYEVTRWDMEEPPSGSRELPVRNLYAAKLFDVSDVNHGMNPATSADGSKGLPLALASDQVRADVAGYLSRIADLMDRRAKEGRVLSQANYTALLTLASDLEMATGTLRALLAQAEPKKAQSDVATIRQLYLHSQRVLAQLHGVTT